MRITPSLLPPLMLVLTGCGDAPPRGYTPTPDAGAPNQPAPPAASDSGVTCSVSDVLPGDPLYPAVCWVVSQGVMEAPGGLFQPDGTFTRALMAKHLVLLKHGSVFQLTSQGRFGDVPHSDPYYRYIQKLGEDQVSAGCNVAGDKFCPGEMATNAHGASLAVRLKQGAQFSISSQQPYFTDVASTHWGFLTIQKLHEGQADAPCGAQTYCPDAPITRGKWARVLYSSFAGS
jgi:hypothetical protein